MTSLLTDWEAINQISADYYKAVVTAINASAEQQALVARMRARVKKLVIILFSGRPLIATDELAQADAFVAAFWPGTEGDGILDVLFGAKPFTGKLSYTWPRSMEQVPLNGSQAGEPLFPFGYGLTTTAKP